MTIQQLELLKIKVLKETEQEKFCLNKDPDYESIWQLARIRPSKNQTRIQCFSNIDMILAKTDNQYVFLGLIKSSDISKMEASSQYRSLYFSLIKGGYLLKLYITS